MISKYLALFSVDKRTLCLILFITTALAAIKTVVDPIAMQLLIDEALVNKNHNLFVVLISTIVFISILSRVGVYITSLLKQKIANRLNESMTQDLTQQYFDIPYQSIKNKGEGYYINRVYDEPSQISSMGTQLLVSTFENIIIFITAVAVCLYLSWQVTAALVLIVPVLYAISSHYSGKIKSQSKDEVEAQSNFREGMIRSLEAYKLANIFDLKNKVVGSAISILSNYLDVLYNRAKTSSKYRMVSHIFMSISESLVLAVAATAVFMGMLTVGGLMAYMTAFWKMMYSVVAIVEKIPEFSNLMAYIERNSEFEELANKEEIQDFQQITANNLNFAYKEKTIFSDVNFNLEENENLIIHGSNGSGKSTLLHMMCGFLPSSGKLETPKLNNISAMLAPLNFYKGTLADHLNYEKLSYRKRRLADDILIDFDLFDKLNEDPDNFSEGQKRKAQLVLTLLKDADVYIFDEPLAAIDTDSKDVVMHWIQRITDKAKTVVVMHGDDKYKTLFNKSLHLS